jgi:uncharacterized iron-regulated membrane protein
MKLPVHAFRSWWEVHAWAGVVSSLVLCVMFFAGAFALFREPIAAWQDPRLHGSPGGTCAGGLEAVVGASVERAGFSPSGLTVVGLDGGCGPLEVDVQGAAPGERRAFVAAPAARAVLEPRSNVSKFLFDMHFLHDEQTIGEYGTYVAGVLAVVLLLTLVTGLLIHLKDFVRQLHQLRVTQRARVFWSDLHKVVGVMGLPFQIAIALSGALLCLDGPMQKLWEQPFFRGDVERAVLAIHDYAYPSPPEGVPGERATAEAWLDAARRARPDLEPEFLHVYHFGDAASSVDVGGRDRGVPFGFGRVRVDAGDGEPLWASRPAASTAMRTGIRWLWGLHFAWFGGVGLKLVYALLALAACATILSGNWVWLERRDRTRRRRSNQVLARLTIAVGLGVAVAVAAMFVANRALPITWRWHIDAERWAFVGAWIVTGVWSFAARSERVAAVGVLGLSGALFTAVPFLSFAASPLHPVAAVAAGAWDIAGVDLGLLVLGGGLLGLAQLVRKLDFPVGRSKRAPVRPAKAGVRA